MAWQHRLECMYVHVYVHMHMCIYVHRAEGRGAVMQPSACTDACVGVTGRDGGLAVASRLGK